MSLFEKVAASQNCRLLTGGWPCCKRHEKKAPGCTSVTHDLILCRLTMIFFHVPQFSRTDSSLTFLRSLRSLVSLRRLLSLATPFNIFDIIFRLSRSTHTKYLLSTQHTQAVDAKYTNEEGSSFAQDAEHSSSSMKIYNPFCHNLKTANAIDQRVSVFLNLCQ